MAQREICTDLSDQSRIWGGWKEDDEEEEVKGVMRQGMVGGGWQEA